MLSVTARAKSVTQPRGGYLPLSQFTEQVYDDDLAVIEIEPAFASMQGTAVDYLSRLLCGFPPEKAFEIPLAGAEKVGDTESAAKLLAAIDKLNKKSILAACKLTKYDVAFRQGTAYFKSFPRVKIPDAIVNNIKTLVGRTLAFLRQHEPVIDVGFTFGGGYTSIVSSGDGDYLTSDGMWDLKVSKAPPKPHELLQILMYYIMGCRSTPSVFKTIRTIGIFNPLLNRSYSINVADIPDKVFQQVSRTVIGYSVPDDPALWRDGHGEDPAVISDFFEMYSLQFENSPFDPDSYSDGIYTIRVMDYWRYYRSVATDIWVFQPKFSHTDHVLLLKNSGFIMFVSVSSKGSTCILQGARMRRLERPVEYYYERLPAYGTMVLNMFSKYWDALYSLSEFVRAISPKKVSAKVHGCIVDIDFFNHIYLNPLDGSIVPYSAESMYSKHAYKNLSSLIAAEIPTLQPAWNKALLRTPNTFALPDSPNLGSSLALTGGEIELRSQFVSDTSMYNISNRLKALQLVYDYRLVAVWYDSILPAFERLEIPPRQPDGDDTIWCDALLSASEQYEIPPHHPEDDDPKAVSVADQRIQGGFKYFVKVQCDTHNSSPNMRRAVQWISKRQMKQDDFFAIIRKLFQDNESELLRFEHVFFCATWQPKSRVPQHIVVTSSPRDVLLYYKDLFVKRSAYHEGISFRFEIKASGNQERAFITVDFHGGKQNPLSTSGSFRYQNNSLVRAATDSQ